MDYGPCLKHEFQLNSCWVPPSTQASNQLEMQESNRQKVEEGDSVGYGCMYRCNQNMRIAVFPVGYYDGYLRLATGKAHVLVNQKHCPVIGQVMMNHIIVDVTHATQKQNESISAELMANWAETIHYEIFTCIGSHLP